LQVANRIGGATGRRLVGEAHHAYLQAMRTTYTVGVLIIVSAMVVAYLFLPARAPEPIADIPVAPPATTPTPDVRLTPLQLRVDGALDD
jgi:hypothetical protein